MGGFVKELLDRIRYWRTADRLGPDIPWTHWRLYFSGTMFQLCRDKFCHFGEGAEFRPGAYAVVCSKIEIGARVVIRPGTMLFADPLPGGAGILVEDDVLLGAGVHIYTSNHRYNDPYLPIIDQGYFASRQVILRRGCWVGANSTLLPGVEIGENSVVGAGSIVTRSIPPYVIVTGSPARVIRHLNEAEIAETGFPPEDYIPG